MYERHLKASVRAALADTPVVLLNGARQAGKSTLAQQLIGPSWPARYVTLDDVTVLAAARADPSGFIAGFDGPVVIDEIQRAEEIFLPLKAAVDRRRQPGRFLLTGSANVLLLPRLADSLAGRMEILTLWPLSQGELHNVREDLVDRLLAREFKLPKVKGRALSRNALGNLLMQGGFPEVIGRAAADRRRAWFNAYLTTLLQRDVRELANIGGLTEFPRLLSLLATRAASLLNLADLSRATTIPQTTLKRYLTLLQATYLIFPLPPWAANLGTRLVKAPKLMLGDTGLLAHLLGLNEEYLQENSMLLGALLENFVALEVCKQVAWSQSQPQLFHFRTHTGQEVDLVLEDAAGKLAGIEVKASASVNEHDFKGLRALQALTGKRFRRGVVFYTGDTATSFGADMFALPLQMLWQ